LVTDGTKRSASTKNPPGRKNCTNRRRREGSLTQRQKGSDKMDDRRKPPTQGGNQRGERRGR